MSLYFYCRIFKYGRATRSSAVTARMFSNYTEMPIITAPVLSSQIKVKKTKRQRKAERVLKSGGGDKSRPVITSQRVNLNHYVGQSYNKSEVVPLVSKGWNHRKSIGDQFTINCHLNNPSMIQEKEELLKFEELGLHDHLVEKLEENGFIYPTNIQAVAIPKLLRGHNSLITSETGNGKTFAFLLPILDRILKYCDRTDFIINNSPLAIIVTPSRELAIQIKRVAHTLTAGTDIHVRLALGGSMRQKMLNPTINKAHLLVGSFGAISKLTTTQIYKLNCLRTIAFDEVDTLLDDSFKDKVMHFMRRFPIQGIIEEDDDSDSEVASKPVTNDQIMSGVQVMFASATIPKDLGSTFSTIIDMDSLQKIKTPFLHKVQPHVKQTFIRINHDNRVEMLLKVAKSSEKNKYPTMIFSNDSKTCDWISFFLTENGMKCLSFHANKDLKHRHGIFDKFQDGEIDFISCTDLASRGLDTVRVRHIINYNFPKYLSDYIHRCGRTGRVGALQKSLVTNFIHNPLDIRLTQKIEESLRMMKEIPNVNANIKRLITATAAKYDETEPEIEI